MSIAAHIVGTRLAALRQTVAAVIPSASDCALSYLRRYIYMGPGVCLWSIVRLSAEPISLVNRNVKTPLLVVVCWQSKQQRAAAFVHTSWWIA